MIRILSVSALVALVGASRVQKRVHSKNTFGASCDDLQTSFSNRLTTFQESVDSMNVESGVTRGTQARQTMRAYGIVRTLRRARTCSWVMDADNEDMVKARGIAQILISDNPCADAARSEMQTVSTTSAPQAQVEAMTRTMAILISDTCEASQIPDDAVSFDETMEMDEQLGDAEESVQDGLDDLMEASEGQEDSFIQLNNFSLFRLLGVIFVLLFLLLACSYVAAAVLFFITFALGVMLGMLGLTAASAWLTGGMVVQSGASLLFPLSIASCAVELYQHVLPGLID